MTRGYTISRIILTVLMSFCIAGYILSSSADALLSLPGLYTDIIREEKLAEKAYTALENDFKNQYNTTAVPPEVYMDAISEEWLQESMCISIENNINCHLNICIFLYVYMTISGSGFDNRNCRFFYNRTYQICSSTWNQNINILI